MRYQRLPGCKNAKSAVLGSARKRRRVDVRGVELEAHTAVKAVLQVGDNADHGDIATFVCAATHRSPRCKQSALPSRIRAISIRGKLCRIAQTIMP